MPIKFDKRTFKSFKAAVRYLIEKKGWTKERASRYVAGIEQRQRG